MRKKRVGIAAVLAAVAVLTAFVAYRRGVRRATPIISSPAVPSGSRRGGCIDFHEAEKHTGESSCISGRVLRVFTSRGGNTFLDFCSDYRQCPFTAVIFASDRPKFGKLGALDGQRVEIEGRVGVYQGRPEIVIREPEQLRALSGE